MALEQRKLVQVPEVVGLPLKKALLLLQQAGLSIEAVLYKESYEERDLVLEQKPPRRQMVYAGQGAVLAVSRESYIKWLPSLYQRSDVTGKNYVRDLLWIIQHLFGSVDEKLEIIHQFFDPHETPEEFLPWLAGWSAMILEADWPVNHKRKLIKKAMELYRLRGTVRGLSLFISLFTGFEPTLRENEWPFKGFRIGASSAVGIDTVILPPVDVSRAFMVVMPHKFRDLTAQSIIRLLEIIEMEKPAHTTYMLKFEEPPLSVEGREFFQIGVRSGINVGDEVVTPLPMSQDTGEPEYPVEVAEPPQQPDPSVYDLFQTKKRELPRIEGAPRADNAPVEGKEITTSKAGFEGVREFLLEDIMRELLRGEGGGEGGEAKPEGGADKPEGGEGKPEGGGDKPEAAEDDAASKMRIEYGAGSHSGARAPRVELEREEPGEADEGAGPGEEPGADPAAAMKIDYGHVEASGQKPKIEVEVERGEGDGDEGAGDEGAGEKKKKKKKKQDPQGGKPGSGNE